MLQTFAQDGQTFNTWAQLVVEQADRCDWVNYWAMSAALDAVLFKIAEEDFSVEYGTAPVHLKLLSWFMLLNMLLMIIL